MAKLSFDYSKAMGFLGKHEVGFLERQVISASDILEEKIGPGKEYLGWLNLPVDYDKSEFKKIKEAAEKIKSDSEVLVVIGIGGSYLGAKAGIEFLNHSFHNNLSSNKRKTPEIYFAGTNISGAYLTHLLEVIGERDFSINVISKSGTTTEPAIAFRILKKKIEEKYGREGAKSRIYATTDKESGALKKLADQEGYETFVVPDDIGGRYSVLTAVGLLPMSAAGIDIDELMNGAADARKEYNAPYENNHCYKYAAVRNILHRKCKEIELFVSYEPRLRYVAEWWKQLYGESEGKDKKGIYPASAEFTTDLHSLGQYIQDGKRNIFETVVNIEKSQYDIVIEKDEFDLDGLNYLSGKTMDYINKKAVDATVLAHTDGGVPNLMINIPEATAYHLGYLFYFFEKACAISGYLLGVNPFDQPGVERYKKNMFALLEKPGYEKESEEISKRIIK